MVKCSAGAKEGRLPGNVWAALDLGEHFEALPQHPIAMWTWWADGKRLPHLHSPYSAQHIPGSCGFYFWTVSPIHSFLFIPSASVPLQVLITSHLHYYNSLLNGLSPSVLILLSCTFHPNAKTLILSFCLKIWIRIPIVYKIKLGGLAWQTCRFPYEILSLSSFTSC